MELEKSSTILHIRRQNCLLATRLYTQFHYIYKIPNTCLLLQNQSEIRSRKSWELVPPLPSNPLTMLQLPSRTSKEKLLFLSVNKFIFFSFGIKNCLSVDNLMSPGLLPSPWCWPQRRPSLLSKLSWRQENLGMRLRMKWLTQKLWIRKPFFRKLLVKLQVFLWSWI